MSNKKAFTLVELLIALVILGLLAAICVPYYNTLVQQGTGKAAEDNLIAIYNAQKTYYYANGVYCVSSAGVCGSSASVNAALSLNINDNNFTYTCSTNPFGSAYVCYATNNADANFLLTLKGNTSIVMPGGTPSLNPSCQYPANPTYCPS